MAIRIKMRIPEYTVQVLLLRESSFHLLCLFGSMFSPARTKAGEEGVRSSVVLSTKTLVLIIKLIK